VVVVVVVVVVAEVAEIDLILIFWDSLP